jgi:virginiamycin B lyase
VDPSNEPPAAEVPKKPPVLSTVTFLIVALIVGVLAVGLSAFGMVALIAYFFLSGTPSRPITYVYGSTPPPTLDFKISSAPGGQVTIVDDASPPHETTAQCAQSCLVHVPTPTSPAGRHTFTVESGDSTHRDVGRVILDVSKISSTSVTFASTVASLVLPNLAAPPGQKTEVGDTVSALSASGAWIVGQEAFHDPSGRAVSETPTLVDVHPSGSVRLANSATASSSSDSVRIDYDGSPHATAILSAATTGAPTTIDGSFSSLGNPKTFPYTGGGNLGAQTLGPDKLLWAAGRPDQLARVAADGTQTQIDFRGNDLFPPDSMVLGPDGNFWMTYGSFENADVVRVTPTGAATRIADARFKQLAGIASGPDGNIWVANKTGFIFRITPAGAVTSYSVGTTGCGRIAFGADGKLYYACRTSGVIGALDTTRGTHVEFTIPRLDGVEQLVRGADGNIWFSGETAYSGNAPSHEDIGWLAPSGANRVFALPASVNPSGLAAGADGNIWFGDRSFGLRWITGDGRVGGYPLHGPGDLKTITVAADGSFWIATSDDYAEVGGDRPDLAFIHVDF